MGKLVVVDGAVLRCNKGLSPSPLKVSTPFTSFVGDDLTATVMDKESGKNVKSFGVCAITKNVCKPLTPSPWKPGESSVLISSFFPILCADSFLTCGVGGIIQIQSPGQSFFTVDSQNQVIYDESGVAIGYVHYGVDEEGIPVDTATYFDLDGNVVGTEREDPEIQEAGPGNLLRPLASRILGNGITRSKVGTALFGAARRTLSGKIPAAIRNKLLRSARGRGHVGGNPRNIRQVRTGRLGGYKRVDTDLPGGRQAARETFRKQTGRNPVKDGDSAKTRDGEVIYRDSSRTGDDVPKVEIINHVSKTIEKITFK